MTKVKRVSGKKKDDNGGRDTAVCNHVHWTHANDDQDFKSADTYLTLLVDPDDAEILVEEFQVAADSGAITHYKPKDLLRASRLVLASQDNPDVVQHLTAMRKGTKLTPPLLIRGKRLTIAAGYHRVCAGYYDDMNCEIPCIIIDE